MFRKLILLAALCAPAFSQVVADCTIGFTITTSGVAVPPNPNGFDNRQKGCQVWALTYSVSGFSAVSVALESAPNNAGAPGAWGTYSGQTIISGANPNSSTTTQMFAVLTGYQPWVRVKLLSATGAGIVAGVAYGWASPENAGSGGGGTSNVNIVSPIGQQLMGASVAVVIASNQSAVPVTISSPSTVATNLTQFAGTPICNLSAPIALSGSGNTQIVAASGSKVITICHISLSTGTPENIQLTQGVCAGSPTALTGTYQGVLGIVLDFPTQTLSAAAGNALCVNQQNAQTTGGLVTYGQN